MRPNTKACIEAAEAHERAMAVARPAPTTSIEERRTAMRERAAAAKAEEERFARAEAEEILALPREEAIAKIAELVKTRNMWQRHRCPRD